MSAKPIAAKVHTKPTKEQVRILELEAKVQALTVKLASAKVAKTTKRSSAKTT